MSTPPNLTFDFANAPVLRSNQSSVPEARLDYGIVDECLHTQEGNSTALTEITPISSSRVDIDFLWEDGDAEADMTKSFSSDEALMILGVRPGEGPLP